MIRQHTVFSAYCSEQFTGEPMAKPQPQSITKRPRTIIHTEASKGYDAN